MSATSTLLSDVLGGHRLTEAEATRLLCTTGREVFQITSAADEMRERHVGDTVTYVKNQNLHVTISVRTSVVSAALAGVRVMKGHTAMIKQLLAGGNDLSRYNVYR